MTREEAISLIKALQESNPYGWHNDIIKQKDLIEFIFQNTKELDDPEFKYSIGTRVYWFLNDLHDFPECECPDCHNKIGIHKNVKLHIGYARYCSPRCGTLDPKTQEKQKQTNLSKYGVESTNSLKSVIDKKQKTIASHFGNGDIKTAYKDIVERSHKTYQERTGYINAFVHPDVVKKRESVNMEKYGCKSALGNKEVRKLGEELRFIRLRSPEAKEKFRDTMSSKSKEEMDDIIARANKTRHNKRYEELSHGTDIVPLFSRDELKLSDYMTEYLWHCNVCGTDFADRIHSNYFSGHKEFARCPVCHPINPTSSMPEQEIAEFISSLGIEVERNNRKEIYPQELDIFIPSKSVAIEYDGLFWHNSDNKPDPEYHLKKTNICKENGIFLIQLFEDEWTLKREIVESRIKSVLGMYDRRIYARDCEIRHITVSEAREFMEKNHLQGYASSSVFIGLFYGGELVSCMCFSKSRFQKDSCWEMTRFANKMGVQVVGGASKLLTMFSTEHRGDTLVSYADKRWSDGNLYLKLEFELKHSSSPAYWYIPPKETIRENRMKYQKHKLPKLLPDFDSSLSEWENMQKAGYTRIYDCGNFVFTKILS